MLTNTPPKFNIAPEKWWLEDYFPIGMAYLYDKLRQGKCFLPCSVVLVVTFSPRAKWYIYAISCSHKALIYLDLLVRCLEKFQKSSPKWWWNDGDFHPMGSQSVKNHKKKTISGQITILPKPECFGALEGDGIPLLNHHHLGWPSPSADVNVVEKFALAQNPPQSTTPGLRENRHGGGHGRLLHILWWGHFGKGSD